MLNRLGLMLWREKLLVRKEIIELQKERSKKLVPFLALAACGYYFLFAFFHLFFLPPSYRIEMMAIALASSLTALAIFIKAKRNHEFLEKFPQALLFAIGALVLLNSWLHFFLSKEAHQATNLMIASLVYGAFLYSPLQFYGLNLAIIVGCLLGAAGQLDQELFDHFVFALTTSIFLSILIFHSRRNSLLATESLQKLKNEQHKEIMSLQTFGALGELAGGVAHEINNPLAIMCGRLWQLEKTLEGKSARVESCGPIIASMKESTERISAIVNTLLAFSREEFEKEEELLSLKEVIQASLNLAGERLRTRHVLLEKHLPEKDQVYVRARRSQLTYVILRLLYLSMDEVKETDTPCMSLNLEEKDGQANLRFEFPGHQMINVDEISKKFAETSHAHISLEQTRGKVRWNLTMKAAQA